MNGHELRRRLDVHEQIAGVYKDTRFPRAHMHPDLRTLAVAVLWVVGIERPAKGGQWARVYEVLNFDIHKGGGEVADGALFPAAPPSLRLVTP